MKKVVLLHPVHWEHFMGGAELQISYLAKYLLENNYEVHFIYENNGVPIKESGGIILHPLKKVNIRKTLGQRWFLYWGRINKKLREIGPDVIYTRLYSSWAGIAARYARKNNIVHIWAIASDKGLKSSLSARSLLKPFNFLETWQTRFAFKNATAILTQNSYQQREIEKRHNRHTWKILQMTPVVNEDVIIKPKEPVNVLWIANLKPLKRPGYFIELARELSQIKNCRFYMIGRADKNYSGIIEEAYENIRNFEYLGEITNSEVNEWLCKSHILINTSDHEGFSNTFVQAWMRKVPVISINSNPDSIITNQKIGFVCPTMEELKEKTGLLISDEKIRIEMGEKAYKYARKNHSLERNIIKIINLMTRLK